MKILWITNTIFPEACKRLGLPVAETGGWMYGLAKLMLSIPGIELAVATAYHGKHLMKFEIKGIHYYLIPSESTYSYQKDKEDLWKEVCDEFIPHIVHIHGTEWPHGLTCMQACPELNYVVSIQGLIGICNRYYFAGINKWEIFKSITFRDIVKLDTLFQGQRKFEMRGLLEYRILQKSHHIIGRTSWDYTHSKTINPTINYHFCNEVLRRGFYSASKWELKNISQNTIFMSQASYPIKGLHQVIKAVALLKKEFPDIKIRVAGQSITDYNSFMEKIKISGYGSYLRSLIKKWDLWGHIQFTGLLKEEEMINEYQKAHLFICPSSIENSSNSVGEAQLIGVPTIASYVGGLPDMIIHGKSGLLYRFEEVEMLAENIRMIFTNNKLAVQLSLNEIDTAEKRHNRQINLDQTVRIYNEVLSQRLSINNYNNHIIPEINEQY